MVNSSAADFIVQFWGVRGQISVPGKETIRYGGNTACVEMRLGNKRLIFDGGSGLRVLGNQLLSQMPVEAYVFFTHCHWDRIQGFPFFIPAFIPGNCFHIYGAEASDGESMQQRLSRQMLGPNFPVPLQIMASKLEFNHINPGSKLVLDDVIIETSLLNYSQRSVGYRVTWQGHTAVYATASCCCRDALDRSLRDLAAQADLLILNAPSAAAMTEGKESCLQRWQDTPWEKWVASAAAANVKQFVLSSYDPDYNDDFLDQVEQQVQSVFPNSVLAREGMVLPVGYAK
jgi:phosphoribosyl 1,2-cyclic phosphodiesterase